LPVTIHPSRLGPLSYGDPILRMLRDVVGLDQVLFGTDLPYIRRDLAVNCVQRLELTAELTADERTRGMSGDAIKLFPRLAALVSTRRAS
jgi:6-methylsalicylate decarboxylase